MYQRMILNGVAYEVSIPIDVTYTSVGTTVETDFTSTAFEAQEIVNGCDHCGRFNLEPKVLHTIEELVEAGWIRRVE